MNKALIVLALVTACGASEQADRNGSVSSPSGPSGSSKGAPMNDATLTGLYEGGPASQPNQLCIVEKGPGNAQFGLVVWGANLTSCAGSGSVVREGETLRLEMTGDETCRIEARIKDGKVTLPEQVAAGCAYYCGPTARFSGPPLTRKGSSVEDALKAKDLVGESLCSR